MRTLALMLALVMSLPLAAQQVTPAVTDSNGRKLVPARRCLVYEDDPEATKDVATTPATAPSASAGSLQGTSHPIVLPKQTAATSTHKSSTKTPAATHTHTAKTAPLHANTSTPAAAPILNASVHVPKLPNENVEPAPYEANPIQQLRGNARVLLIFAPAADSPIMQQQMLMIERHQLELAHRNTVLVPILNPDDSRTFSFNGEHLDPGTAADLAAARKKFEIKPAEFAVILLDDQGIERTRWSQPVSATDLDDQIDAIDDDAVIVHNLNAK